MFVRFSMLVLMSTSPVSGQATSTGMTPPAAAFMAQIAPRICQSFDTDYDALRDFMVRHHLSQDDLFRVDRSGPETLEALRAFEQAFSIDRERACAFALGTLGQNGANLVH